VLALAVIAIISFDLALSSNLSLPLMPLLVLGSLWSYLCRHVERNVNIAVLGFVGVFACYWVAQGPFYSFTGDTRTWIPAIAFSFIFQTIGLWQAYSRSVLSSSVMLSSFQIVGAILFANDIKFSLLLILFLLIIVPTLWLIYRSTINLSPIGISIWPIPKQLNERHLPWWYLFKIVAITLASSSIFTMYLLTNEPIVAAIFPNDKTVETVSQSTVALTSQQTNQAVQNILATADQLLNTQSERIEYVTNYLQSHTQPGTCREKDGCTQEFRQQMEQLAAPCPKNNQQCQKDWKFVADRQELAAVYEQLTRSITSNNTRATDPSLSNSPVSNELTQASPASTSTSTIAAPNAPTSQPTPTPNINNIPVADTSSPVKIDYNPDTNKYKIVPSNANESLPNSEATPPNQLLASSSSPVDSNNERVDSATLPTNLGTNNSNNSQRPNEISSPQPQSKQQSKDVQANKTDQATPPPRPPKNQWLNFLSIILLVLLVLGTIWYFQRQQPLDEKAALRKKLKSHEPLSIEQIYEFMLQELRLGGKVKLPYVTEFEFARLIHLYYPGALSKVIAEISGDYVAWRYGQQTINETIIQQNFSLFCQLHNSIQSAKLGENSNKTGSKSTKKI
jgi:hypothetical protein